MWLAQTNFSIPTNIAPIFMFSQTKHWNGHHAQIQSNIQFNPVPHILISLHLSNTVWKYITFPVISMRWYQSKELSTGWSNIEVILEPVSRRIGDLGPLMEGKPFPAWYGSWMESLFGQFQVPDIWFPLINQNKLNTFLTAF